MNSVVSRRQITKEIWTLERVIHSGELIDKSDSETRLLISLLVHASSLKPSGNKNPHAYAHMGVGGVRGHNSPMEECLGPHQISQVILADVKSLPPAEACYRFIPSCVGYRTLPISKALWFPLRRGCLTTLGINPPPAPPHRNVGPTNKPHKRGPKSCQHYHVRSFTQLGKDRLTS